MARFRKIDPRIWNDARFRALSDDAKLIFLLLLTHPHMTALGAMRATLAGLAAEIGWVERRFRRAFGEILRQGMVRHDERAALIWLPNFLKFNTPENPNVVRSWQASLDLLPECGLKDELMRACRNLVATLPKGFAEGLPEPFRKGMPNQEHEQEQEQEPEPEQEQSLPPPTPSVAEEVVDGASAPKHGNPAAWPSPEALVAKFNADTPASVPKIRVLSPARRKKAGQVLALFADEAFWTQVVTEYHLSGFLQGQRPSAGHERFRADFDWLVSRGKDGLENCVKVHEGKYRDISGDRSTTPDARAAHNLEAMQSFLNGGTPRAIAGS